MVHVHPIVPCPSSPLPHSEFFFFTRLSSFASTWFQYSTAPGRPAASIRQQKAPLGQPLPAPAQNTPPPRPAYDIHPAPHRHSIYVSARIYSLPTYTRPPAPCTLHPAPSTANSPASESVCSPPCPLHLPKNSDWSWSAHPWSESLP